MAGGDADKNSKAPFLPRAAAPAPVASARLPRPRARDTMLAPRRRVGGLLFGIGMVLAGGCGASSIWRAGEGHVKLWVTIAFFAVGSSLSRRILVQTQLLQKLGTAVFLPNVVGWAGALWLVVALLGSWYVLATWNERSRK